MIQELFRWIFRMFLYMVFWVFFLSIPYNGSTLFSNLQNVFVNNNLVSYIADQSETTLQSARDYALEILKKSPEGEQALE